MEEERDNAAAPPREDEQDRQQADEQDPRADVQEEAREDVRGDEREESSRSMDRRSDDRHSDDRRRDDRRSDRREDRRDDRRRGDGEQDTLRGKSHEELEEIERNGFKLFIGNLNFDTAEPDLRAEFGRFGELMDVFLPRGSNRRPRGFGFVTFVNKADAEKAVEDMDGKVIMSRELQVNFARPRALGQRGGRDRGGRDRGGRDRYDDRRRDRYDDRRRDRYDDHRDRHDDREHSSRRDDYDRRDYDRRDRH
eukprot:m.13071 g.13071  ORF g.13071 m.13071 type:complete len:252 (+) comp7417_c0_seq1:48-803(+)